MVECSENSKALCFCFSGKFLLDQTGECTWVLFLKLHTFHWLFFLMCRESKLEKRKEKGHECWKNARDFLPDFLGFIVSTFSNLKNKDPDYSKAAILVVGEKSFSETKAK